MGDSGICVPRKEISGIVLLYYIIYNVYSVCDACLLPPWEIAAERRMELQRYDKSTRYKPLSEDLLS